MSSFPVAVLIQTTPTSTNYQDDAGVFHDVLHQEEINEITSIETYLGTNATQTSPTAANAVLNSTSATAATWATTPTVVDLIITTPSSTAGHVATVNGTQTLTNKTLTGNTAVNLVSGSGTLTLNTTGTVTIPNATDTLVGKATTDVLTNKTYDTAGAGNVLKVNGTSISAVTGSGSVVLATSPTLTSPIISTPTFSNNDIKAAALDTAAITLGYAQITSNFTTASTTAVQVTSLTASVTIPAGGRRVKITVFSRAVNNPNGTAAVVSIWDGTVGSGTQLTDASYTINASGNTVSSTVIAVVQPAAGAKTYNVGFNSVTAGTSVFGATATGPGFILVEAI